MRAVLRFLKCLFILLCVCLPLEILGWIVLIPGVALTRGLKLNPSLKWFDSADSYVGRDVSVYQAVVESGKANQYFWLAFRNPINYFGYVVLGVCPKTSVQPLGETISSPPVGDTSKAGYYHAEALIDGKKVYEYYVIYRYALFPNKCFRFRFGHKIGQLSELQLGCWVQFVCCIQPFKDYTGV